MKALLVFPPIWSIFSTSTGIPYIQGYLQQNGYNVKTMDLNIDFYDYITDSNKLINILERNEKLYKKLLSEEKNKFPNKHEIQIDLDKKRLEELNDYFKLNNIKKLKDIFRHSKYAINIIHTPEKFKNIFLEQQAIKTITRINHLLVTGWLTGNHSPNTYEEYFKIANDIEYNFFAEYFETIKNDILKENYDYIGFSVNSSLQTIASLTFSKILKDNGYKGHIAFGGTDIHWNQQKIENDKKLFKNYVDCVIYGQGEIATKELLEYLEGKREKEQVCNIIFLDNNDVIQKKAPKFLDTKEYYEPVYIDYKLNKYMTPEPILPIRASYGCYWGQCAFCDYNHANKYYCRNVDDVIKEIENNIEKYSVNNFYFVDAALSPDFLDEFSKKIIEKNLKIYYFSNMRLESVFTKEKLRKYYLAGLRSCAWGLESGSQKIINKIRKGIDVKKAEEIIKNAYEIGILNHIYYIYGFPDETEKDYKQTYDFLMKNKKYIFSVADHAFYLLKDSYIYKNYEKYNIPKELLLSAEKQYPQKYGYNLEQLNMEVSKTRKKKVEHLKKFFEEKQWVGSFELYLIYSKYNLLKNREYIYIKWQYKTYIMFFIRIIKFLFK